MESEKRGACVLSCKPLALWVGLLRRLFLPEVEQHLKAAPTLIIYIRRMVSIFH